MASRFIKLTSYNGNDAKLVPDANKLCKLTDMQNNIDLYCVGTSSAEINQAIGPKANLKRFNWLVCYTEAKARAKAKSLS